MSTSPMSDAPPEPKTAWWPVLFWCGKSFNGPAQWNFKGGTIINDVLKIYGISLGTRFFGVMTTSYGSRPYVFKN